ncbi:M23 family metallopeptidase [Sphingosinicella terrae]|uniref:M23 family metallopeptidase n=1 Tax=Sphingosinicella terrae TaxID=2172047 RepID=UPI000E0D00DB|nr:M23 family metallopeptidase [Sphingosinicella terrae]
MRRFGLGAVVVFTAIVTAVLTSLFWVAAYNLGRGGGVDKRGAAPGNVVTESSEPDEDRELVVGPGGLAIPVAGIRPGALSDTYTQARASGARSHDAIDIMAPAGTPVVAAAEGVIEKLFFSEGGGGITAYVRSPDQRWVYYYAHLQAYAPGLREGQRVARGDPIGTVGNTGNADPAGPHLHFAVHRMEPGESWHDGDAVNPYPLLAGGSAASR